MLFGNLTLVEFSHDMVAAGCEWDQSCCRNDQGVAGVVVHTHNPCT
jgi:hypothetical protein